MQIKKLTTIDMQFKNTLHK